LKTTSAENQNCWEGSPK